MCNDEADLNEVGKQSTAQFLLQDLAVPVHQIAAWNKCWKQNVGETSITEIWERQWTELLQNGRRLSRLNDHLHTSTRTHAIASAILLHRKIQLLFSFAESEEELIKQLSRWKDGVQSKGSKVNMNKTKVMISARSSKEVYNTGRWPCGVCCIGVGRNSVQRTNCQNWVHRKCSGIKGSMIKVSKPFVCRGCTNQQVRVDRTSMDIGDGASHELCWHVECRWWWCGG